MSSRKPDPVRAQERDAGIVAGNARTGPSFTLGNRAARLLWNAVWLVLFRPSPRPLHGFRALLLRAFGARLGRNCHVYPGVRIWAPWNLKMGDDCGVGDGATLYAMAPITLGHRVVVSQGAHLCAGTHDYESPDFQLYARPITVEADAWLCAECFIGPGVRVGQGTVVGARGVATGDLEQWMVYAGNPCRVVKQRCLRSSEDGAGTTTSGNLE